MKTRDELRAASGHLRYEWDRMIVAIQQLSNLEWGPEPDSPKTMTIRMTIFEALIVHMRLLVEFFEHPRATADNVIVRHYIPSWESPRWDGLNEFRAVVHRNVLHISYTRHYGTWEFPHFEVYAALRERMKLFEARVDRSLLDPERWGPPLIYPDLVKRTP